MKKGAPKKKPDESKGDTLQIRVNSAEKQAFSEAAKLDGKKRSEWMRDRLRRIARQELEEAGLKVPFLPPSQDN